MSGEDKLIRLRGLAPSTHPQADALYPEPNPVPSPEVPLLRVASPILGDVERRLVNEVLDSGFISSAGAMVGRFEEALAGACGTSAAVAVTCGTHALDLLMYCFDVGPGDEVIVPATTFLSVGTCVARAGARPVFVDVERDTLNLTAEGVAGAITDRTRGVIAAHTFGNPCDMDAIAEVLEGTEIFLLEDACEALGASLRGRPVGGLGDVAVHSFYANKMITTGNGGALTTSHEGLLELVRHLRGYSYAPGRFFWHAHMPFNVRMSALQAAVGLAQVERLPDIVSHRKWMANAYGAGLQDVPGLGLPTPSAIGEHVYWMYTVHVDEEEFGLSPIGLRRALAQAGIETRPVFSSLHVQPILQAAAAPAQGPMPNAEWAGLTGINLPSSPLLEEGDVSRVCDVIRDACGALG